ncbi:MAG: helix-turn-helix domain-containing protein [Bacteroidales bacterium]|nr:helix-turn-helix domain-containing protein [Bacteroidales bacterium]
MNLEKTFCGNLRVYRAKARLTRAQLAEKADLKTHTIIRMENEQGFLRFTAVEKLAKALGIPAYRFFEPLSGTRPQAEPPLGDADLMTVFSDNLKIYRGRAGLTQKALSEKSGVSNKTITHIESKDRHDYLKFETLEKLSDALKIPPANLFIPILR